MEKYVKFLETYLLEDLKEKVYYSIEDINRDVRQKNSGHQQREKDFPVPFQN